MIMSKEQYALFGQVKKNLQFIVTTQMEFLEPLFIIIYHPFFIIWHMQNNKLCSSLIFYTQLPFFLVCICSTHSSYSCL